MRNTNIKTKVLLGGVMAVCLGTQAQAAEITAPIDITVSNGQAQSGAPGFTVSGDTSECSITDDLNISSTGGVNDAAVGVKIDDNNDYRYKRITMNLDGNVAINVGDGRALFMDGIYSSSDYGYGILNINRNKNKTVKIIGDVSAENKNEINMYLNNEDSYFAGKLKNGNYRSQVNLELHSGATWYTSSLNTIDMNTSPNASGSIIRLALSGGVLDFYHSRPGVVGSSPGEVTIKNYTGGSLNGTTFRIKSDINGTTGNTTKFKFNSSNISSAETYYVQVAYDPSLSKNQVLEAAGNGQQVFDLSGLNGKENVTVEGRSYSQATDAGLNVFTITPTVEQKGNGWNIVKLVSTDNATSSEENGASSGGNISNGNTDGPAMKMAQGASVVAQTVLSVARADNNDLLRRMGDLRNSDGEAGAWIRYYTGESDVKVGTRTSMKYKSVQGGYDKKFDFNDGKLFAGVAVSHTDGDFSFAEGGGDSDTTMFGVYASYVGNKGHFADMILKYGRLGSDFSVYSEGNRYGGSSSSSVMSLAAEYGYRMNLKGNWYLEPQAELTYGYVGGDDYTMSLNGTTGAHVSTDSSNSFIGRLGINVGKKIDTGSVYAKLSVCREFAGDVGMTATYGSVVKPYSESMKDTWIEYGLGFNTKVGPDVNLYGEVEKSTGSVLENKWRANIGLRYTF